MPEKERWCIGEQYRAQHEQLDTYRHQFNAERDQEIKEQLVLNIASEAAYKRDDLLAMGSALQFFLKQQSTATIPGIKLISNYIKQYSFLYKQLIPGNNPKDETRQFYQAFHYIEQNLERVVAQVGIDESTAAVIKALVKQCLAYFKDFTSTDSELLPLIAIPISPTFELSRLWWQNELSSQLLKIYSPIILEEIEHEDPNQPLVRVAKIFDQLLKFHNDLEALQAPEIYNPLLLEFGGVTLRELFYAPSDLFDQNRTRVNNWKIDQWMSHIPPGDYFFRLLLRGLFFQQFFGQGIIRRSRILAERKKVGLDKKRRIDWLQKIIAWRQHTAEQLLLPGIIEQHQYPLEIEQLERNSDTVKKIFMRLDAKTAVDLGNATANAAIRGVVSRQQFYPDSSIVEHLEHLPVTKIAWKLMPFGTEEEMAIQLIEQAKEEIQSSIQRRLQDSPIEANAIQLVYDKIFDFTNYTEIMNEAFLDWVDHKWGERLPAVFLRLESEITRVTEQILRGSYQLGASRWPEEKVPIIVEFSKNSLARRLNFDRTIWMFPQDANKDVNFQVATTHPDLSISGQLNLDTEEIKINTLNLPAEWRHMAEVISLVAASVLHDMLGRRKTTWKSRSGEDASVRAVMPQGTAPKLIPRGWYWTSTDKLIDQYLAEEESVEREPAKIKKTQAFVPAHVRRVQYGAKVEAMLQKLDEENLSTEEEEELRTAITDLKEGKSGKRLARPNLSLLNDLPPAFSEEVAPREGPSGEKLYTRTFVAPHFNPSLKPEDYKTLDSLFNASYYTVGSTLAFLEVALGKLSGLSEIEQIK